MSDSDDNNDNDLFRKEMSGIRPLSHDRVEPVQKKLAPRARQRELDEQQVLVDMMSDDFVTEDMEAGESLFYARPGFQLKQQRKLRRGEFRVEDEVDLHGLTVAEARQVLTDFLQHCHDQNLRCVRIVHGKGMRSSNKGPVLKQMVNKWLPLRDDILAFCSALPRDGGTGAVYVLLRHA